MTQRGKVYLVGAGPGHPELLTIKAADLLRDCDVVVYDRLIQEEVLALAKPSAERIYMGKPLARHDSRQDEIHELLVRKARENKTVVRLKGGDPFVFGRGGEEAEYLAAHGVPFEVVPGVTAALAAPLSAGIAVTHRESSSSLAIVTGHEARKDEDKVDWAALARIETVVVLMGVNTLPITTRRLIEHGRSPGTPCAMIQMAFWHDEQVVTGTLATIAAEVEKAGVRPPATLVVGEVVRLREKLLGADRDLRRRADSTSRFEPAPAPDQLLRLATAGLGSQMLGLALELRLFDWLEDPLRAAAVAAQFQLDASAAAEILDALTALGLLEHNEAGYRNLELASRYLCSGSPQSLRDALLYQAARTTSWETLSTYAAQGCPEYVASSDEDAFERASESLARFAAPSVCEKIDLGGRGPALLLGWGGEAYRDAAGARWPDLRFEARNPFAGRERALNLPGDVPSLGGPYGAILLSGLLASCNRGEVQRILETAAGALREDGVLALHDAFLPGGVLPAPEVILGGIGRRMTRGGCRTWSIARLSEALHKLGFRSVRPEPMLAGTVLVSAWRI